MSDKTKLNKLQKMSKKTKGKTVVAIMVVILLAACGNSNHTSSNSDSQDSYQTNDNIENDDSNVEVEDNLIVQIDFPNDGYLDDTHIEPQELNKDGQCSIEDDEGRTFDIQLDL